MFNKWTAEWMLPLYTSMYSFPGPLHTCSVALPHLSSFHQLFPSPSRLPAMWETRVWSLGREDPLEKEMATHSSTLAWKIPWTEEPGGLHSMGSQRVQHDWAISLALFTFPVFLPGKSHGQRSLVHYGLWGCNELDMTEWLEHTHTQKVVHYHLLGAVSCIYPSLKDLERQNPGFLAP